MGRRTESELNWPMRVPARPIYIWIIGGSFQGKSLIAASLAVRLGIPHVINTDLLRNILRAQHSNPPKWLGTSTYLLPTHDLKKQTDAVSDLLRSVLEIYRSRGESAIVEGMHISEDIINEEVCADDSLVVGVNNVTDFAVRTKIKVRNTRLHANLAKYNANSHTIDSIHDNIICRVRESGGWIVDFDQPEKAASEITEEVVKRFEFTKMRNSVDIR